MELTPGDLARVDQVAAQLGTIVGHATNHAQVCETRPAGVCIGEAATVAIRELSCGQRMLLLEEAIAQLARQRVAEKRP